MKTVYEGLILSEQFTKKELKKAVEEGMKLGNSVESILRGLCLDDSNPLSYGIFENKEDADKSHNSTLKVCFFESSGVKYADIVCQMTKIYTVDDDGEYYQGADYDCNDYLSEKDVDEILDTLGIRYIDRTEEEFEF